ncbi:ferredoxin [Streptomyces sp. NPDC005356]|uniref:ferredoxin n=1 Tax=Streptomyces sp. NPDC005356 TaxID=3157167 RepID=UPI0033BC1D2F
MRPVGAPDMSDPAPEVAVKVVVDRSKCISLAVCETVVAVFELDEDAELIVHDELVAGTDPDQLRVAIQSCPVKALSLDD